MVFSSFSKNNRKNTQKYSNDIHNSIQIWYSSTVKGAEEESNVLQLDINIWQMGHTNDKIFFDFGMKVFNAWKIENFSIYFPFKITKDNVLDLGHLFSDLNVVTAVFNKKYSIIQTDRHNCTCIKVNDAEQFFVYKLSIDNNISINENYEGSILTFQVNGAQKNECYYYRFRIIAENYGSFIEIYRPNNRIFESAFIETEVFDFRINEQRNQDEHLLELIQKNNRFSIENINFFFIAPIEYDIISDYANLTFNRRLEAGDYWKKYLSREYGQMGVFKVRENTPVGISDDFSCFAKITYRSDDMSTIAKYLLCLSAYTFFLSVLSNLLSPQIRSLLQWIRSLLNI